MSSLGYRDTALKHAMYNTMNTSGFSRIQLLLL